MDAFGCRQDLKGGAEGLSKSFRRLYDRYSSSLFRFIYRFTDNQAAAEEILHDVFFEFISGKYEGGEPESLKAWLFTLARNKSLNYLKKSHREVSNDGWIEATPADFSLEEESLRKELMERICCATGPLSDDLQRTWNLRREGLDYRQIADRLAIPVGTVKSRFHRIVEIFRKELT
jgi:RNA polymerase sigma-70 factor (ECF subfamily)